MKVFIARGGRTCEEDFPFCAFCCNFFTLFRREERRKRKKTRDLFFTCCSHKKNAMENSTKHEVARVAD